MSFGVTSEATYEPEEIRGPGKEAHFMKLPVTIEEGQDLEKGQVIGIRPTTEKYIGYENSAAATATEAVAGGENTGGGSMSSVAVQDNYTLTEEWTVTCTATATNGGTFSVTGSVSGAAGNATVGSEFKYPNSDAYRIKFTISDGEPDFAEDDVFTFSTVAAGATTATGVLTEDVDASSEDVISTQYVKGIFITENLTDLDSDAKTDLGAREVDDYLII